MINPTPNNHANNDGAATIDQQILQKKIAEFSTKLQKLQEEYGLVLVPILNQTQFGIFPDIKVFTNERYSELMSKAMSNVPAPEKK